MEIRTMKALQISQFGKEPELVDVEIPKPGANQILVKMSYCPINPSDYMTILGLYPSGLVPPTTVGFEGSGVVHEVGDGCIIPHKEGDAVCIVSRGTWAEYALVQSELAFPISEGNSLQDAASHYINPCTVICMVDIAKKAGAKTIIHDAGSSALGKMLIKICKEEGIKTINLVRNSDYFEGLTLIGSDFNLNINDENFITSLKSVVTETGASIYFSAVAGELTGNVLKTMPYGSTAYVYGALSGGEVKIGVESLIFQQKEVKGLWLAPYFHTMSTEEKIEATRKVQKHLKTIFKTDYTLFDKSDITNALNHHRQYASSSKSLLKF